MKLSCGNTFLFGGVELNRALHELLLPNTAEPAETGGPLLEMAQEDQNETSQQTATSVNDDETKEQASPSVIKILDSTSECEEDVRSSGVQMEEKAFISSLHSFMKDKGTPIERIPHLGFKQINLWMIYKAVDKLGGYDSVTARRLWKKVYDELGGSPGSTSAATCTRRHYERLVLPFERCLKGEEDKPLPPSKPRKPYKRSLDGRVNKCDAKRKKAPSDREMGSELLLQRSPEAVCRSESRVMRPHSVLWAAAAASSERPLSNSSAPNQATADLCTSVYAHILQSPASASWMASVPPAAAEVISPLEKKKRLAQASLSLPQSCQSEEKERPSVIRSSPSPARAFSSRNGSSSDGSPFPFSSSSSRSPSPSSDSSEGRAARNDNKFASSTSSVKKSSDSNEEGRPVRTGQTSKDRPGHNMDISQDRSQPLTSDPFKTLNKDFAWRPHCKGTGKYVTYPCHSFPSFSSPTSSSSFTKVNPKSTQLLRPTPIRPDYKTSQTRLVQQDASPTCVKKLNSATPWSYQAEKKEKCRMTLEKLPTAQHNPLRPSPPLPMPCVLSSYDKSGRDTWHQPLQHPAYHNSRARLPHCQLLYRHPSLAPAVVGTAVCLYPFGVPLLNPQTGYPIPAMHPIYSHKL